MGPRKPLTFKEVHELYECSPSHLSRLVARGAIPHFRVGLLIRFCPDALLKWQETGGSAPLTTGPTRSLPRGRLLDWEQQLLGSHE